MHYIAGLSGDAYMNDILPPKRRLPQSSTSASPQPVPQPEQIQPPQHNIDTLIDQTSPLNEVDTPKTIVRTKSPKRRIIRWIFGVLIFVGIVAVSAFVWYQSQLGAVEPSSKQQIRIEIASGMGPSDIASLLASKGLIKNEQVFSWYVRIEGVENMLQAGQYMLSKSMTVEDIVTHLQRGQSDTFRLTFYPGAVLRDETNTPENKKTDVTTVLKRAGYSKEAIAAALKKQYSHPLLAGKPASADLEGYIYGETYEFASAATVEDILTRTFDEMYKVVKANDLVAKYKKHGLTLYEGITLASVVQREVNGTDQKQVAGVFYNRLKQGMMLGSDVTYQYIADKTGQARSPDLDSRYNTRKYTGLPPGPIASPGESALLAVADPTLSDYLFFLSGDDDKTYFGRTQAEHERNIQQHCQQKCQIL